MGFQYVYKSQRISENTAKKLLKEKSTLLPFFGFTYQEMETDVFGEEKCPAEASPLKEAPQNGRSAGTYRVAVFSRDEIPTGRVKELEDKIFDLLSQDRRFQDADGNFDPFRTPYFSPSLYDYYYDHALFMNRIATFFSILFLLPIGLSVWQIIDFIQKIKWNWIIAIICAASYLILPVTYRIIKNKRRKGGLFFSLSPEERKKVQQQYLESLETGNGELDELLKEYAGLMKTAY